MRAIAALVLVASLAGVLLAGAQATAPGKNGRIAFTSNRDDPTGDLRGNFEIYTANPDGSGVRRLTNNAPGIDGTPVWSTDGKRIAFRTNRDHYDPDPAKTVYEIYSMNADGTGQRRLTETGGLSPSWSPDSKRIAFSSLRDGNQEIYAMNADGSAEANLSKAPGVDNEPSWGPAGKIAFASDRSGTFRIWTMNADGSGAAPLSAGPNDHHPAWSPDGKLVLFARSSTSIDLYTVRADGTGERQLTSTPKIEFQGGWSPDARMIVFSSDRESSTPGLLHLFTMNANGTGIARFLPSEPADLEGDWQAIAAGPTSAQALAAVRSYLVARAKACKLAVGKLSVKSISNGFRVSASLKRSGKPATAIFDVVGTAVKPVNATAKLIARSCR